MPQVDAAVSDAQLTGLEGTSPTKISALYAERPCFVLVVRRPGCVLCRHKAQQVWQEWKPELEAAGWDVVAVVHQGMPAETKAFKDAVWPGALYLDDQKVFYKMVHGGNIKKGSLLSILNPFGAAWKRVKEASKQVKEHNLVGDGTVLGGFVLLAKGGIAYKCFPERDFGEYASLDEVKAALPAL